MLSPAIARLTLLAFIGSVMSLGLAFRSPVRSTALGSAHDGDLAAWSEIDIPPAGTPAFDALSAAARRRSTKWLVTVDEGTVTVRDDYPPRPQVRPAFKIDLSRAEPERPLFSHFGLSLRCATEVEDGWLLGFNKGEWGGGTCWFSADGNCCRVLAPGNVTAFVPIRGGYLSVGGLQHLSSDEGWVHRLGRVDGRWEARRLDGVTSACLCGAPDGRGGAVVVTSDGVLGVGPGGGVAVLATGLDWLAKPGSVAVGPSGSVYVGMQGYVAVVTKGKVRMLAPPAGEAP